MRLHNYVKCKTWIGIIAGGLLLFQVRILSAKNFDEQHIALMKKNPKGLSLTIFTDKDTYGLGEIIPIKLTFCNESDIEYSVETRVYDRSGRLYDIAFYADGPSDGCSDPLDTRHWGIGGGLGGGVERLGQYSQVFILNEWIRFDIPGEYRVYCTTYRVIPKDIYPRSISLCSQIIKIRIKPADETFVQRTIDRALKNIASEDKDMRYDAIRRLRFLATPESIEAIVPFLGGEDQNLRFEAYAGIIGSRDWEHARKALLDGMENEDIAVNSAYIDTLADISLPREAHLIDWDPNNIKLGRKQYRDLETRIDEVKKKALDDLANVYNKKTGRALGVTSSLLLEEGFERAGLKESLASSFFDLTDEEQKELLQYQWEKIRCPEFEPVLSRILETPFKWEQWIDPQLSSLALLHYMEYNPEKAREVIINDMKRPEPLLARKVLFSLPDEFLPEIEDMLVSNLTRQYSDKVASLVERYATTRVLPQIIEFYQKHEGRLACSIQASLLRYWVKHDRSNGLAAVVKAISLREHTRCYTSVLWDVLSACYGPDAEEIAISFLNDEEPDVVVGAVRLLARKGTKDCIDPLLAKLASLDPDKKKQGTLKAGYSELSIYYEIVRCLMYEDRWRLSDEQKQLLKQYIRTDKERNRYKKRFESGQKVK